MYLLNYANWGIPRWLNAFLPHLGPEGAMDPVTAQASTATPAAGRQH
jgi:hypothetical protein